MSTVAQDLRYAVRVLRNRPVFTLAAAATLALGIGATSAIVTLVDRVLLHPLPGVGEPERVVEVATRVVSLPAYRDFRADARFLRGLAAYSSRTFALGDENRSTLVTGMVASGNYYAVLRGRTAIGRALGEDDDRPASPAAAVISHRLWHSFFGGDTAVIGRTIRLNDRPVTVVGVAAQRFRGTRVLVVPDVWIPIAHWQTVAPSAFAGLDPERRTWSWLTMVGRLAPGATIRQVEQSLQASASRQAATYPDQTPTGYTVALTPVVDAAAGVEIRGAVAGFLTILGAVVGFVLLIACANVANLLIARAAGRRHETAVRRALGATRGRLIRQLLTEAAVLGALGGGLALLVAETALAAASGIRLPMDLTLAGLDLGLDWRVAGVAAALAVLSTLIFGLVPAWQGSAADVASGLRQRSGDPRGRYVARHAFLVVQVALSLVLLVGTGLFVRSLSRALLTDPGFRAEGLALASVNLGLARYTEHAAGPYYEAARTAVLAVPGVEAASWVELVPLTDEISSESFTVPGYEPRPDEQLEAEFNAVGPDYFGTMGIPLIAGRGIEETDGPTAPLIVVINETLARRYYGETDPVGRPIGLIGRQATVVGVARDHVYHRLGEEPRPYVHVPLAQRLGFTGRAQMTLIARAAGEPEPLLAPIRDALERQDPRVPVYAFSTTGDLYAGLVLPQRVGAALLGGFSLLGLILAVVGVYGVVAYTVAHRARETGIRIALGAARATVVRHYFTRGMIPVVSGVVAGLAIAALGSGFAAQFLYRVAPLDPLTYAATALLLTAAGALAAFVPARRATRLDPMEVLRHE